jgi:hypothetical protein
MTQPQNGGAACPSIKHTSVFETRSCNKQLCPVDCEVSQWSKWGACSVVCGPGIKARTRGVVKSARHGGKRCPDLVDEQDCQGAAGHCPIDCVFEWKPWTQCSATCGGGSQYRDLVVTTWDQHGGIKCPERQDRTCNEHACPTHSPTPPPTPETKYPTPAPTPRPFSKPIIEVLDGDDLHVEATKEDNYVDAGATCYDLIDGNLNRKVRVSGDVVNLAVPGAYHIKYDCKNSEGEPAYTATRTVYVEDNTCPWCEIKAGPSEIEASFPYADPGATCYDTVDGKFAKSAIVVSGLPNVDVTGTYVITYRVKDSAGNWNDGQGTNCRGAAQYRRKVTVIDSLKPVLALRFKDKQSGKPYTIQMSNEVDETTHFSGTPGMVTTQNGVKRPGTKGFRNPAYTEHPALPVMSSLMAEQTSNGAQTWAAVAVLAAVAGVALLVFTRKSTNAALPQV